MIIPSFPGTFYSLFHKLIHLWFFDGVHTIVKSEGRVTGFIDELEEIYELS